MLLHEWLPAALEAAGIEYEETSGWRNRSHGSLPDDFSVVWHHDASPPGDSPGALNWMIDNWQNASANLWINRYGKVFLVGTGVAWHAGKVGDGFPGNFQAVGIETDHTTGEDWPAALLDSLRKTTAVLLKKSGRKPANGLYFHKQIAVPAGRKQDPDGLEINYERNKLASLLSGTTEPAPTHAKPAPTKPAPKPEPPAVEDDEDEMKLVKTYDSKKREVWGFLNADGRIEYINDPQRLALLRKAGAKEVDVTSAEYNSSRATGTSEVK